MEFDLKLKGPFWVEISSNAALLSAIEPKTFNEDSNDEFWKSDMKEELDQIEKCWTWELVPRPQDKNIIDTKWVYKNKLDENGRVIRNKARLVCKGILKWKELILIKLLHLWLGWNWSGYFWHSIATRTSRFIKWMLSRHS